MKPILLVITLGLVIAAGILVPYFRMREQTWVYYYPLYLGEGLEQERRPIPKHTDATPLAQVLLEDYFLGPVSSDLKFPWEGHLEDVWVAKNGLVIVNFALGFQKSILDTDPSQAWSLRALIQTVRENTSAQSLQLWEDGKPISLQIADMPLEQTIPLQSDPKKRKRTIK